MLNESYIFIKGYKHRPDNLLKIKNPATPFTEDNKLPQSSQNENKWRSIPE